ncbi:MFS transporter [Rhodococcus sp. NPDC058505]|uniref:MFS transporter n=1 Tax=unclassified Rhodococcus (in: high G+C Gram-positive bacteria) TaxID=192944 RepID=UPI0036480E13
MTTTRVEEPPRQAPTLLLPALCLIVMTISVLQTVVVPIVGRIGIQLGEDRSAVGWVLTANLLAAAVATPILGRLADLRGKRPVLIGVLVAVLCGSLIAAVAATLPWLVLGRVLQGASFALFPIGIAVLRDELPTDRLVGGMGLLSGTLGVGGAAGMVVTGLLVHDDSDYRRVFWLASAVGAVALAAAVVAVPPRARAAAGTLDWTGAVLLAVGLILVLLALSEGGDWGWRSPPTVGCAAAGIAVLAGWFAFERRAAEPLVSPRMLTHRPVLVANITAMLVGAAMFVAFLACSVLVQTPPEAAGYGFGATIFETGVVYLLPGAVAGVIASTASGRLLHRFGARAVMITSCAVGVGGFVLIAVSHDLTVSVIVAMVAVQVFISLAYAALPAMLVAEVSRAETGVANSVNSICRTVGSSLSSALVSTLLATLTVAGTVLPREGAFVIAFGVGAGAAALALVLTVVASGPLARTSTRREGAEVREGLATA